MPDEAFPNLRMPRYKPTSEAFESAVEKAFEFLRSEFNFVRRSPTVDPRYPAVVFADSLTQVVVEGIDWGLNTRVALGSSDRPEGFENFDLDDLIALRAPDTGNKPPRGSIRSGSNQLEQLPYYATMLRSVGADVLRGDHSVFTELEQVVAARRRLFEAG